MTKFDQIFADVPAGRTVVRRWASQDRAVLDAAAAVVASHGANPWVFAADARHFWQFASKADVSAMQAMTPAQFAALCGEWDDEDYDPTSFGYRWPD